MADMHIQGPDGKMHVYPEGTSDDDILKDMHAIYKPLRGAPPPARAGDPAIMTSPVPSPRAQYVQPYKTDEDWQNVREAMILGEKNRGVIQAIQNTPGRVQRMKEAEEVGKSQGKLSEMQRHGAGNLRLLDQIRATFDEADEDSQKSAIGPAATSKLPVRSPMTIGGIPVPLLPERPTTVDPVSGVMIGEEITPVKRAAIMNPKDDKAKRTWDLQNRLLHDIEGLTTKFIMTGGGGVNMSDARQKAFTDTIGAMIHATGREQFHNIANDAENIIRETFGLSMPQAAQLPGVNPAAVQELMKDTSGKRRQQFDVIFGEGAADQVIKSMNARRARSGAN